MSVLLVVVGAGVVGRVEIVRKCEKFGRDGVDLFDKGRDTSFKSKSADGKLGRANAVGELSAIDTISSMES